MESKDTPSMTHTAQRVRRMAGPLALGIALLAAALAALWAWPAPITQADGPDTAHVVVQFSDDRVIGRRIDFSAPISGLKALQLTGLEVITYDFGWGIAVCSIQGVGCPGTADDCFNCDPSGSFWSNSYWDGTGWHGYLVGASDSVIGDGAIDGWRWGPFGSPLAAAPPVVAAADGLEYLRPLQSVNDGGYGSGNASAEVLYAVAANGYRASQWQRSPSSPSLMGYFLAKGAAFAGVGPGSAGKLAVALTAGDGCWPVGATQPISFYHPATGAYSSTNQGGALYHAWGMLGTAALSQAIPGPAVAYLKAAQQPGGSWEWSSGSGEDTNSTALDIQALVAAGEPLTSTAILSGLTYLESAQNDDGGFPYSPVSSWGTDSDTNSSAYVVQALLAAGESPTGTRWVTATAGITPTHPISYLLNMQLADGSFRWQAGSDLYREGATRQAIPALLGRPFPISVAELAACKTSYLPMIFKQ